MVADFRPHFRYSTAHLRPGGIYSPAVEEKIPRRNGLCGSREPGCGRFAAARKTAQDRIHFCRYRPFHPPKPTTSPELSTGSRPGRPIDASPGSLPSTLLLIFSPFSLPMPDCRQFPHGCSSRPIQRFHPQQDTRILPQEGCSLSLRFQYRKCCMPLT